MSFGGVLSCYGSRLLRVFLGVSFARSRVGGGVGLVGRSCIRSGSCGGMMCGRLGCVLLVRR